MKGKTIEAKKQKELEYFAKLEEDRAAKATHPGRPFYATFDEYVVDYPEGERFRAWLTKNGRENVTLLAMNRPDLHNSLPGAYLAATIVTWTYGGKSTPQLTRTQLTVHDDDDGMFVKFWEGSDQTEARALLSEMMVLAPFLARDCVEVFGLKTE